VLRVVVTPRALAQIERAAMWWLENRPAAPDAIRVDFEAALRLLAFELGIGSRSSSPKHPDLRRIYLSRIGYHVYYRVKDGRIQVLAFWHASRGSGPPV
jgi:plasmid stabilization system protein ParE